MVLDSFRRFVAGYAFVSLLFSGLRAPFIVMVDESSRSVKSKFGEDFHEIAAPLKFSSRSYLYLLIPPST